MRSSLELVLALEVKVNGSDVNISSPLISALINHKHTYSRATDYTESALLPLALLSSQRGQVSARCRFGGVILVAGVAEVGWRVFRKGVPQRPGWLVRNYSELFCHVNPHVYLVLSIRRTGANAGHRTYLCSKILRMLSRALGVVGQCRRRFHCRSFKCMFV